MAYKTEHIRNLALVGHAAAGKTLLAEALLYKAGAIRVMGDLTRGTTVCDSDPMERELGHSIDTAVCHFDVQGQRVNLIDTPGYLDLLGRSQAVLAAVETAVIVVDAQSGIDIATRRITEAAVKRGLDRIIVINKIDHGETDCADCWGSFGRLSDRSACRSTCRRKAASAWWTAFLRAKGPLLISRPWERHTAHRRPGGRGG